MKKLVLIIPLLAASAIIVHARDSVVTSFCPLAIPQQVRVFDWTNWNAKMVADKDLYFEPFHWDASQSIWRGYDAAKPFDQPDDAQEHWKVTLTQANGAQQWIYVLTSPSTPDKDYVYVFPTIVPYGDSQGKYFGFHPCAAFAANAHVVNGWFRRVFSPHHKLTEALKTP